MLPKCPGEAIRPMFAPQFQPGLCEPASRSGTRGVGYAGCSAAAARAGLAPAPTAAAGFILPLLGKPGGPYPNGGISRCSEVNTVPSAPFTLFLALWTSVFGHGTSQLVLVFGSGQPVAKSKPNCWWRGHLGRGPSPLLFSQVSRDQKHRLKYMPVYLFAVADLSFISLIVPVQVRS